MEYPKLNLPDSDLRIDSTCSPPLIFDKIRRKKVVLTPEEWVRQNFIFFLTSSLGYPLSRISVEHSLKIGTINRRCDIVVFNRSFKAKLIVECKAPSVKITQKSFDQIFAYNLELKVDFLVVTNGVSHYCCKVDFFEGSYRFLQEIPFYDIVNQ